MVILVGWEYMKELKRERDELKERLITLNHRWIAEHLKISEECDEYKRKYESVTEKYELNLKKEYVKGQMKSIGLVDYWKMKYESVTENDSVLLLVEKLRKENDVLRQMINGLNEPVIIPKEIELEHDIALKAYGALIKLIPTLVNDNSTENVAAIQKAWELYMHNENYAEIRELKGE